MSANTVCLINFYNSATIMKAQNDPFLLKTAHYTFSSPYDVHMHGAWLWEVDIFSMFYIQLKLRALLKISLNLEAFIGYPGIIFHITVILCPSITISFKIEPSITDDIYTKKMID